MEGKNATMYKGILDENLLLLTSGWGDGSFFSRQRPSSHSQGIKEMVSTL